jgi:hypothetical protein
MEGIVQGLEESSQLEWTRQGTERSRPCSDIRKGSWLAIKALWAFISSSRKYGMDSSPGLAPRVMLDRPHVLKYRIPGASPRDSDLGGLGLCFGEAED